MDVTEEAVNNAFKTHGVKQMIHGHTHRQNTHQHQDNCTRYVLNDWHTTNSIMKVDGNEIKIKNQRVFLQALLFLLFRKKQ